MVNAVHTIDLNFMGKPGAIAVYLAPHPQGVVLVESGPGSTIPSLQAGLRAHGFTEADVTDVLLTHIHLDHAGAAGWLARQGARIHVHPNGAPHLLDPQKLLQSAARIYGDQMETLWGEFLPVPAGSLHVLQDQEVLEIEGLCFRALNTPGHANHHYAYRFEDICFTGDIGGVRLAGLRHLRLPMPPPELQLEQWRQSLLRLQQEDFARIAPTHFGIFSDPDWHLAAAAKELKEIEGWVEAVMPGSPSPEALAGQFLDWTRRRSLADGLGTETMDLYELASPSWMSSQGILRYWMKYRSEPAA